MATNPSLLSIIDAIAELTPTQRRQLQRRLYASGLFVADPLLTDQNRLETAPALGNNVERKIPVAPQPSAIAAPLPSASFHRPHNAKKREQSYRSPVSGTVVVGAPNSTSQEIDPHLMPPLPGQAPEQPITMIIERGTYLLRWPGESPQRVRLSFNEQVTEQEVFYDTLIRVLEIVAKRLEDGQADLQSARLDIRSDDALFIRQVRGEIPCEEGSLTVRHHHVQTLLNEFGAWRLNFTGSRQ